MNAKLFLIATSLVARPGITTRSVQQGPDTKNITVTGSKLEGAQDPVTLPTTK